MSLEKWKKIYSAYDGTMKGCRGKDCTKPCCGPKETSTRDQGRKIFNTTIDPEEFEYQQKNYSPLEDLDIETERVDVNIDRGAPRYTHLIRGCFSKDGTCKLADRKPVKCRVFPLSLKSDLSVREAQCPHVEDIAADSVVKESIKRIRESLGMSGHEEWEKDLDRRLKK